MPADRQIDLFGALAEDRPPHPLELTDDDLGLREMPPMPEGERTLGLRPGIDPRTKSTAERLQPYIDAALRGIK